MSPASLAAGPAVDAGRVHFHLPDPGGSLTGVRLWQEVRVPGPQLGFRRSGDGWRLSLPRPPVDRMEYLFELRHRDGGAEMVLDPTNPRRVGGAFGDHSVLEFPGYRAPEWWAGLRVEGTTTETAVRTRSLGSDVYVRLWAPADAAPEEPLPLLLVHDGPEYDDLADVTGYSAAMLAAERLPRHRVALLGPGDRNDWYSASTAYAAALCLAVLPALRRSVAVAGRPVGMGASLGALAMLHAQRRYPGTFAGLLLQSGSFFVPVYDAMEAGFSRFGRIVRWVSAVRRATTAPEPLPVVMTCGTIEENLRNNVLMHRALGRQGYPVRLATVRDVHNFTAWRDAFDPHLTGLLTEAWPSSTSTTGDSERDGDGGDDEA